MENTSYNQEQISQVNSICEHNWHEHSNKANIINADSLFSKVKEMMYYNSESNLKMYVNNWINEFSTRTGTYKLLSKEKGVGAGGRVNESVGHISYV